MASAPDPNANDGHPLTRSLVPRTTAPPTSYTRQSSQTDPNKTTNAPVTNDLDDNPIDSALNASSKTGESLTALLKALGEFQGDISSARDSHERLQLELQQVRELLGRTNAERLQFRNRVEVLEAELRERSDVAELDTRYVQEEQDRFIAALIDEHEEMVKALRAERDEALAKLGGVSSYANPYATIPSPAPEGKLDEELRVAQQRIDKMVTEREKARGLVKRAQAQRDAAQVKAERLEKEFTALKLRLGRVSDDKHTRPTDPPPDSARNSAEAITERPPSEPESDQASRAKKASAGSRPPLENAGSRELQLSELEEEWDRTTTPAPPPSYEGALDESRRAPGSLRHPSIPAELRAALTAPGHALPRSKSAVPSSSMPRVISAGAQHKGKPHASPTLPKITPSLEEATRPPTATPSAGPSQPPSTMGYPADKRPPLQRKPDPTQRPLVGYSKSGQDMGEERIRTRPFGTPRTRS